MTRRLRFLFLLVVPAVVIVAVPSIVPAQVRQSPVEGRRRADPWPLEPATSPIVVDGALTEPAWRDALVLELKYEVRPGENVPPPVRTEVLLTYDTSRLFVAFRAHDPDPGAIRARFTDRDALWSDDFVGIVLDTFNDQRRAYEFIANPLGVQADMLMDDTIGNEDAAWNAIWDSAGRVTEAGYEVEFAIPFSQLRFESDGVSPLTWGFDAYRSYPRGDRHHIGLFPRLRGVNSYLSQAERIQGLIGITPGQNIQVVPTLTMLRSEGRPELPDGAFQRLRTETDVGVTATWGLTPNVTLNGTINPDFSQVEADAVQLDINTQFALFFNETRPFFLEGADFFRTTRLNLVYTRQIVQPEGAAKLSGKIGRHAFGVFSAYDKTTSIILPGSERSRTIQLDTATTSSVGRYRFDVGRNSTLGALAADRRGAGYDNTVLAFDTRHRFTTADSVSATVAVSSTADRPEAAALTGRPSRFAGAALEVLYSHSARSWYSDWRYTQVDGDFRADLGFVTQVDYRQWLGGGGWVWHGGSARWFNRIQVGGDVDHTEEIDGTFLEREYEAAVQYQGPRESYARWGAGTRRRAFNGVVFEQVFQHAVVEARASGALFAGFAVNWGDWIDFAHTRPAAQRTVRPYVTWNYGRHVTVRYSHIHDVLDVAGGRLFSAHVPEARIVYQHDARTLLRAIVQYTDVARNPALHALPVSRVNRDLLVQLLFSYKVNPQTVFYLGYNDGSRARDGFPLTHASRTLFAKASYAWLR